VATFGKSAPHRFAPNSGARQGELDLLPLENYTIIT
jgi:hypothetical protein